MGSFLYQSFLPHSIKDLPGQVIVPIPEGCHSDAAVDHGTHWRDLLEALQEVQRTPPLLGRCHAHDGILQESEIKHLRKCDDGL